ncbi:hypothetical protein F2Q68_00002833 [Brassica cretica]|uniref:Uncharacterized protein n=1 Tax=Brassica cretica TaxID=69181 RepID=A0A8S9JA25_BRACR|nr:hypothetical protein F2Q68_00002833 [Brassica cretica]
MPLQKVNLFGRINGRKTRRPTHRGPYIDSVASQKPTNQTISFLSGLSYFHRLSPVCLSTLLLPNLLLLRQTLNINVCVRFRNLDSEVNSSSERRRPLVSEKAFSRLPATTTRLPLLGSHLKTFLLRGCHVLLFILQGQVIIPLVKQNIATMVLEREGNDRRVSQSSYSLARHRGRLWKDGCLWARSMVVAFILKHGSALEAPREELEAQKITMILDQDDGYITKHSAWFRSDMGQVDTFPPLFCTMMSFAGR